MRLPEFIEENVPLAGMTTFRIGGPARWLARPSTRQEAAQAWRTALEVGAGIYPLGGGSNLLVADAGVDGMIVSLSRHGELAEIGFSPAQPLVWRVGASASLASLMIALAGEGIGGLEQMTGVPGTVGGTVCMNAGGAERGIGEFVARAEVIDKHGEIRVMEPPELDFAYRSSSLRGFLALSFTFHFSSRDTPDAVRERMRSFRERKKATQPLGVPSAGCVFKNPPGEPAGALLDQAGCKGMREGGAVVSDVHANYIVNAGDARSRDVAVLAVRMRDMVRRKFGITLEPEIVLWGDDPAFSGLGEGWTQ